MKYKRLLSYLLYFTVVKLGPKIYLSAFEFSITGVLVACASDTISLPRVSPVAWAFLTSTVTFIIGFFVGLATSHVCP